MLTILKSVSNKIEVYILYHAPLFCMMSCSWEKEQNLLELSVMYGLYLTSPNQYKIQVTFSVDSYYQILSNFGSFRNMMHRKMDK